METNVKNDKWMTIIWVCSFVLSNFRGSVLRDVLRQGLQWTALPWVEVFLWITLLALVIRSGLREKSPANFMMIWKQNWPLVCFVGIAILSISWSIYFQSSLYRAVELLCCTAAAAYLGFHYSIKGLRKLLFDFGTLLLILSFVLAVFLPIAGRMMWEPYDGAWRGIYWHKNHFGGIAAFFNMVFLVGLLDELGKEKTRALLNGVFYLFSIVLIYFSKSAAAYMLFLLLNSFVFIGFFWLKTRHRLKAAHYYSSLGIGILALVVVLFNLDLVFGLFGRDTTLTGRSGLWIHLLRTVVGANPWFGYGWGAIWSINSFRVSTQHILGWGFPVAIGDNGFIDILLHVGIIGFIPFIGVILMALLRFLRFALKGMNLLDFAPLFVLSFVLLSNISFSFLLEVESFVWLILIAMLFSVTRDLQFTS